jgi:malonyl-CoA decarboxylase
MGIVAARRATMPVMAREMTKRRLARPFERVRRRLTRLFGHDELQISADLPADQVDRMAAAIEEAIARRDPLARRAAAARVIAAYKELNDDGQRRFFELLATRFGAVGSEVDAAVLTLTQANGPASRATAERRLRTAIIPRYAALLHVVTGLPEGVKLLVDLRADLLPFRRRHPAIPLLDDELAAHLTTVFDVGLLELRQVTWESTSAALLERLIAYEAVHEIDGWDDLKDRLDSDRRCYAFLHPAMPNEPLVFVEIALTKGLADSLPRLLDQDAPKTDPASADTAIFYAITNCQAGLAGVNLGNELIKHVVETLRRDLPNLKRFATLSPIPSFRAWVDHALADGHVTPGERDAFATADGDVVASLATENWSGDGDVAEGFRRGLLSMVARYLTTPVEGRSPDPVGNFHLSNGARLERVNWLANPAEYELQRSYGLMVNYCYELGEIEQNVERYLGGGEIAAAPAVRALVK